MPRTLVNDAPNKERVAPLAEVDDPRSRQAWLAARRVDAAGKPLRGLLAKASVQRRRLEAERFSVLRAGIAPGAPPAPPGAPGTVNWTPIGPSVIAHGQASNNPPVSGRVNALAAGPGGLRVYAGAANGGIWGSTDAGLTWAPLDDYATSPSISTGLEADSLSVGAIAVAFGATAANDRIFCGTGEPGPSDAYMGVGVKYSANGGGAWTLEATNLAGSAIYRIVIDPDNPALVFAATAAGVFQRPTVAPFTTWNQVSTGFAQPNGRATDAVIAGSGGSKTYYVAFQGDAIYSSTTLGASWTAVAGTGALGRTVLAAGESDPSVVYALTENGNLYRKDSGTAGAFQAVTGVPVALFAGGQGWYDLALGVDPSNANTVYLVGDLTRDGDWTLSFYKGTITGAPGSYVFPFNAANDMFANPDGSLNTTNVPNDPTWIGRGVHADGHSFAFATNLGGTHDATNVWVGSDGGVFNSTMSGARGTFNARNDGLAITEVTYFGQRADTDSVLVAGAQDQGSFRYRGEEVSFEAPEGDGGGVAVDPNNGYNMIRQYVYEFLSTSSDGDTSGFWVDLESTGRFPPVGGASTLAQQNAIETERLHTSFYSQIGVSPSGVAPTLLTFGTNRVWLSADWGVTWATLPTATNPYGAGGTDTVQDALDGSNQIVATLIASATLIFAATSTKIWKFTFAGVWTKTQIDAGTFASSTLTALAVENAATGTIYATVAGGGFEHVWYYDGSWHATGLLATVDSPAHAVVVDSDHTNTVFAGTDVGVWRGVKTGLTWAWSIFSDGLPESAVLHLAIHERARLLRAGTHGRGIWEITLDALSNSDPDIYLRVNYADTGRIVGGSRYPWVENVPDPTSMGHNVYHWMSADIKVRRPNLTNPPLSPQLDYFDFAVNVGDYIDSVTHIETADLPGTTDMYFVEVHNRGTTALPGSSVQVLLLLADASGVLPTLPANYAAHITSADASAAWLGPNWHFADGLAPYRTLPGWLSARIPQVVSYSVDLSVLGLLPGHDHACAAAFITTPNDPLTATNLSLDFVTMHDKHVAHRNLHLVASAAMPSPGPGPSVHSPRTFMIDFNNVAAKEEVVQVAFHHAEALGHLSVVLPGVDVQSLVLDGFATHDPRTLGEPHASHLAQWFGRIDTVLDRPEDEDFVSSLVGRRHHEGKRRERWEQRVRGLARERIFVAQGATAPRLGGLRIPAGSRVTAAVTVQPPATAKPGDSFRFDIIQRRSDGSIAGGSSYVLAVTNPPAK
jgi:hypothetical protein